LSHQTSDIEQITWYIVHSEYIRNYNALCIIFFPDLCSHTDGKESKRKKDMNGKRKKREETGDSRQERQGYTQERQSLSV